MSIKLLKHQVEPSDIILDFLRGRIQPKNQGYLMIGQTGCGKTFVIADSIKRAQEENLLTPKEDSLKLFSFLYICPKKCITQQRRVLRKAGCDHFDVISPNALCSAYGETFLEWVTVKYDNQGEPIKEPFWDVETMPDVIFVDEVQYFKNKSSKRTQVLQKYIEAGGRLVMFSATPFQKAIESKLIVTAANICREDQFDHWAGQVAYPKYPTDNSPAAVKRIKEDLIKRNAFYEIKGVRYPFKPIIRNRLFTLTGEKMVAYQRALADYHEERTKKGLWDIRNSHFYEWVAWNKLREKCEILRVEELCLTAVEAYKKLGVAVILASNFIPTLIKSWECLTKVHGIDPAKISHLSGSLSEKAGQKMIDDFQEGKTDFFLTTLKSGGTGLSLHDEHPNAKPRFVVLPPTWSVFEMVQVLGRAQRITSRSSTIQEIVWFENSIEMRVAQKLEAKFGCLRELISRKESFIHDVFNDSLTEEEISKISGKINDEAEEKDEEGEVVGFDLGMLED